MKKEQDYIRDIAEIRTMMERSSKFLSLAGWAGIMAGIYALVGAFVAYSIFGFNPQEIYNPSEEPGAEFSKVIFLALAILLLAIGTAILLSFRKAAKKGEKLWNPTAKRLLINMSVPLSAGGILLLIFIWHDLIGLIAPLSLIFYGLALFSAGRYTFKEIKTLGLIQVGLGLIASCFVEYGILLWAVGFGVFHIIYGISMHFNYEK